MTTRCECKQANHQHGTDTMYKVHECRCADCREAATERARQRRREHLYGRHHLTDAEPARQHVRRLMDEGMGRRTIAKAAGVHSSTIVGLLYGRGGTEPRPPRKQISKDLEAKLLAVTHQVADGANVDGLGTARRLQALVAAGWSQNRLADMLGMLPSNFGTLIHRHRSQVLLSTAKRVEELFDAHWDQLPPTTTRFEQAGVTRAKREAASKGWATAAAWDDIDDPAEEPKGDIVDESIDYRSIPTLEKIDRLELLILDGYGDFDDTYVRAGWSSCASATAALRRMGREDLIKRLRRNDIARQVAT